MVLNKVQEFSNIAARAGVHLTPEQAERLVAYGALLDRWNQSFNLTASQSLADILERQVLDCLMVETWSWPGRPSATVETAGACEVVDIGSGAGLPGLVLAVMHPEWRVTSIERVGKKATFQQEATRTLGLSNVRILNGDAHDHAASNGEHYDIALARAFADLAHTLPLAAKLLRLGGILRTYKGRKLPEEVAAIEPSVRAAFGSEIQERAYAIPGTQIAGTLVQMQRV
jgi:16S rRNA (guanine527-N7)-methyltransferase